jgi:hypothetical protein
VKPNFWLALVSASVVLMILFPGSLLYGGGHGHAHRLPPAPPRTSSKAMPIRTNRWVPSLPAVSLAAADRVPSDLSILDNDMDNDGVPDESSVAPLLVVVLGSELLLFPLVGRLLLALWEGPTKLYRVWLVPLEHPG